MKNELQRLYGEVARQCGIQFEGGVINEEIYAVIKKELQKFTDKCRKPAIWCYGNHTKMLMADFIFEIKKVKYIVDDKYQKLNTEGFAFISRENIRDNRIDGIIISSYKYKEEIKNYIKKNFEEIPYFDIYECLEKKGIKCMAEYYNLAHPYEYYREINELKQKIKNEQNTDELYSAHEQIIRDYVKIKDFLSAIKAVKLYLQINNCERYYKLKDKLEELYAKQREGMTRIAASNVVMFCMDGMRRRDVSGNMMPNLTKYIKENMVYFNNAYSVSTSTYESLIPAYSENSDMQSRYYERDDIEEEKCRFIKVAKSQNRKVYFYTDTISFVNSEIISVKNKMQTASEKMWDFLLDALDEENGLFYIHILYESHFSYPNPYTENRIIAEGTSIFFDFLPVNGGKIKTDYECQHTDALHYLDDIISPLISDLHTSMVIYADHGNVILNKNAAFNKIKYPMLTFAEDLIEIPLAVKTTETQPSVDDRLISLMELNNIIVSLLKNSNMELDVKQHIKVQRSKIYNPDFHFIYKRLDFEKGLKAFELFVFKKGLKLVVYEDGEKELYNLDDNVIQNEEQLNKLYLEIQNEVTVWKG